jgi:hypothetical protein
MTEDRIAREIIDRVRREYLNHVPAFIADLRLRPFELWLILTIGDVMDRSYSDGYRDGQFAHEDGATYSDGAADAYDRVVDARWQELREDFHD